MSRVGSKGFTLAEALAAFALSAFLSAAGVWVWTASATRGDVRGAERSVASGLIAARREAVSRRAPVRLVVDPDGSSWILAHDRGAGVWKALGAWQALPARTGVVPQVPVPAAPGHSPWPSGAASLFGGVAHLEVPGLPGASCPYIEFSASGGTLAGRRCVVAPREAGPGGAFREPGRGRLLLLRGSGSFTTMDTGGTP